MLDCERGNSGQETPYVCFKEEAKHRDSAYHSCFQVIQDQEQRFIAVQLDHACLLDGVANRLTASTTQLLVSVHGHHERQDT